MMFVAVKMCVFKNVWTKFLNIAWIILKVLNKVGFPKIIVDLLESSRHVIPVLCTERQLQLQFFF
jgi:hypothetical protein